MADPKEKQKQDDAPEEQPDRMAETERRVTEVEEQHRSEEQSEQ